MNTAIKSPFPALVAVHATALSPNDAGDAGASSWIMLLPKGGFAGRDGRGPYDAGNESDLQKVVAATQKRAGATDLVVDYDHQTVFSAVPGVGGRAPASGWIKEFSVRPDGLWGRVEWTNAAAQAIRAGEYRYISPVYQHDKSGKVTRLISAALTNTPNLDLAAVAASAHLTNQEENMDKIALALGLAQGASEDDILIAINAVLTSATAMKAAAGLDKAATTDAVVTAIQAARNNSVDPAKYVPIEQVTAMQADLSSLKQTVQADKAIEAVDKAIEDGKLAPALKDWGLSLHKASPAEFEAFVAKAPVLTAVQRTNATPLAAQDVLTDSDIAVMNQMGLTREQMLASKKAVQA